MLLQQMDFEGRTFSGHEMPCNKPHPSVYLVIEYSTVGISAGVAAGATVWAYAAPPPADHAPLVQAGGARVFAGMYGLHLG